MSKLNCWEFMKCGKHIGKDNTDTSDVCPVAAAKSADGLNGGVNGGRICWVIATTCSEKHIHCLNYKRKDPCFSCDFRYKVMMEEELINVCQETGKYLQKAKKRG